MDERRITMVTSHSVVTGDTFFVPANGRRVRLEVVGPSLPTTYCNVYLDSIVSGNLAGSFSTYASGKFEIDKVTVGELVERAFEVKIATIAGGSAQVSVIESVVSGR